MDTVDPRPSDPSVLQGTAGRVLFTRMACRLVSHVHREHQVIFHCGGAAALFRVNGALHPLRSGEMILVNPWQSHEMLVNPEGESVLLSILFNPAEVGGGSWTGAGALLFRQVHRAVPRPLHCALDATVQALMNAPSFGVAQLRTVLTALVRVVVDTSLERDAAFGGTALARPYDFRIQRALQFILRSGCSNVRVDELPALAGMSRSHFFRQFRRCLGVSPHDVVDYVQITMAIERLGLCGRPIRVIARDLGFTTSSHFARFFANHLGTSPRRYQRATLIV
jgi:AraC family transcriptional regulator